jgi:hypothetical protein
MASFSEGEELIMAIGDYIDQHSDNPKLFIGTPRAFDILERVKSARHARDKSYFVCRSTPA